MIEHIATIIPTEGTCVQKTQGTRVVLEDGTELGGVTGITIRANRDDIWRATIDCVVRITPITASSIIVYPRQKLTWRERLRGYVAQTQA